MYSVLVRASASDYDETITALSELGTLGLIEEAEYIRAFFASMDQARAAMRALPDIVIETREEKPWVAESGDRENWDPILVGTQFFIAPSCVDAPAPRGRMRITVDAQSAFGSGRHESTQLMIRALETYLQPGMTVLDVGCGSGILAAAAHMLGAGPVFACDIDPNSISVARQMNDVALFAGSADAVRPAAMDLVLANISARVVDVLAPDLNRVAKADGRVILAGFLRDQPPQRFHAEAILKDADWECWICRHDPILAEEPAVIGPHSLKWW